VYADELKRRGVTVKSLELVRESDGEQRTDAELKTFKRDLAWCTTVIGFEFLGDKRAWGAIKKQDIKRAESGAERLQVVFVPNLEYTKRSNEAASNTMQNLERVDVIVAKTEDIYERLHMLFLERKFGNGCGNLVLVPHISPGHSPEIIETADLRDAVIHFPGSSNNKNTKENCLAAARLIKEFPVLRKLIIKCSHTMRESTVGLKRTLDGEVVAPKEKKEKACVCETAVVEVRKLGVEVELVTEHLSDEAKGALYGRCRLAMCASKTEGFGHYILEASGFGCQVVTTDGVPMRSLLKRQVALVKPKKEPSGMNLGLCYSVDAEELRRAGEQLLRSDYSPLECRRNLEERIESFRQHFAHLLATVSSCVGDARCYCEEHMEAEMPPRESCELCGEEMHGELCPVNFQAPDKLCFCHSKESTCNEAKRNAHVSIEGRAACIESAHSKD
jgi:glycosyltransferase involved in cell wall biosynthesis